jgi:fructose-1,6-bisphosphatase I
MSHDPITLAQKVREDAARNPDASDVPAVIDRIALAAGAISLKLGRAGIADVLGLTGDINGHGEAVRKLDSLAHDTIVALVKKSGCVAGLASEESEEIIPSPGGSTGRLLLLFDPLDGSSNIDANVGVGTIFSILGRGPSGTDVGVEDFLRPGTEQIAAGYVVYGPSTMLVCTLGNGVHGFTLDPDRGEFILTHPGIETPRRGGIYSVNLGNQERFDAPLRRYLAHLASTRNHQAKPYSLRYIGSLVSDFHRNLLYGGIFLYPGDSKSRSGKLRLLYEASPLAMIAEQAGGRASNGGEDILRIHPARLHQRVPLFIGSADDVSEAEAFLAGGFASISASSIGIA